MKTSFLLTFYIGDSNLQVVCASLCLGLLTHRLPLYLLFLFISLAFLVVNIVCALLVKMSSADTRVIVLVRVAINDTLFVLCAVSLSLCLYKIAKMSLANIYLESKVRNASRSLVWVGDRQHTSSSSCVSFPPTKVHHRLDLQHSLVTCYFTVINKMSGFYTVVRFLVFWGGDLLMQFSSPPAGDIGVSGDSCRSHRHPAVHIQGLL